MKAWLSHHVQSLGQTLGRMSRSPLATLANIVVIGVVLALPLGAYGLLLNLKVFSGSVPTEPQISLFLANGLGKSDIAEIEAQLKRTTGVQTVRFVPRDAALAGLKRSPGMGEVITSLRENPLPDAFVLTLVDADAEAANRLEQLFKALPGVNHVQVDSAWVRRIEGLLRLGRMVVALLATLLGFTLVAVTFNTIRLQVLTHREEIEVSRLVGATDAFIRRPFFYLGALLGMFGGGIGLAIVAGAFTLMNRYLAPLGRIYGVDPNLSFFAHGDLLAIMAFAAILGWLGAYLSVSIHLHNIGLAEYHRQK